MALEDHDLGEGTSGNAPDAMPNGTDKGAADISWAELKKAFRGRGYDLWKREPKVGHLFLALILVLCLGFGLR